MSERPGAAVSLAEAPPLPFYQWDRFGYWFLRPTILDGLLITLEVTAYSAVLGLLGGILLTDVHGCGAPSATEPHPLDNAVWAALNGPHPHFAETRARPCAIISVSPTRTTSRG